MNKLYKKSKNFWWNILKNQYKNNIVSKKTACQLIMVIY